MKFDYDGAEYSIEFSRKFNQVHYVNKYGESSYQKSSRPYTTVNIWKQIPGELPQLFRTNTVGAWHREKPFTLEIGRLRALRGLCQTTTGSRVSRTRPLLDIGFVQAMWRAYHERPRTKPPVYCNKCQHELSEEQENDGFERSLHTLDYDPSWDASA